MLTSSCRILFSEQDHAPGTRWPAIAAMVAVVGLRFALPPALRVGPDCLLAPVASWYWRLDGGGPNARDRRKSHDWGLFYFRRCKCGFISGSPDSFDYLFLAFNTSNAFSPTDVPVLSRWAKVTMVGSSLPFAGLCGYSCGQGVNILREGVGLVGCLAQPALRDTYRPYPTRVRVERY